MILVLVLASCSLKEPEPPVQQTLPTAADGLQVETAVGADAVFVKTKYVQVSYPLAFEEVIRVSTEKDGQKDALVFLTNITGTDTPMYTLWFNGEVGHPVGTLTTGSGETVNMTVQIHSVPDTMTESEQEAFFTAQETVNDVLSSLTDEPGFTPYQ